MNIFALQFRALIPVLCNKYTPRMLFECYTNIIIVLNGVKKMEAPHGEEIVISEKLFKCDLFYRIFLFIFRPNLNSEF